MELRGRSFDSQGGLGFLPPEQTIFFTMSRRIACFFSPQRGGAYFFRSYIVKNLILYANKLFFSREDGIKQFFQQ